MDEGSNAYHTKVELPDGLGVLQAVRDSEDGKICLVLRASGGNAEVKFGDLRISIPSWLADAPRKYGGLASRCHDVCSFCIL